MFPAVWVPPGWNLQCLCSPSEEIQEAAGRDREALEPRGGRQSWARRQELRQRAAERKLPGAVLQEEACLQEEIPTRSEPVTL